MGYILVKVDDIETFKRTRKGALAYSRESRRTVDARAQEMADDRGFHVAVIWEGPMGELDEMARFYAVQSL